MKKFLITSLAALSLMACGDKNEENETLVTFTKPNLIFSMSGANTEELGIICKGEWSVTYNSTDWIEEITPSSGVGNADVTIKVKENTTKVPRSSVIAFNEQGFKITQEAVEIRDVTMLYGNWKTTSGKVYEFDFNADKSCTALVNGVNYVGTYTVDGNKVTITVEGSPMPIVITVSVLSVLFRGCNIPINAPLWVAVR